MIPPGSTIGILGSGQLGRMLALAAARLGFKCHIYSDTSGPAFDAAAATTIGRWDETERLAAFASAVDVVTYEFENVPLAAAAHVAAIVPVRPGVNALAIAQDRLQEKNFLNGLGLPVAPYAAVGVSQARLAAVLPDIGTPAVLKTMRLGYDGKGQARIAEPGQAAGALASMLAVNSEPVIVEGWVAFDCEVSVLAVRGVAGEMRFYDVPLNTHESGILAASAVPSRLPPHDIDRARDMARRIAETLDYVGVLAVEMFYLGAGSSAPLVVNEIAPRVHNSGHWTLDACHVSQFENHVRAVAGWPLGSTGRHSDAVMTNLVGRDAEEWPHLAAEPATCLHIYGKRDARPGRKMGHVTRLSPRRGPGCPS